MEFKNAPKAVNLEEGKRQQEYLDKLKELITLQTEEKGKKAYLLCNHFWLSNECQRQ